MMKNCTNKLRARLKLSCKIYPLKIAVEKILV